MTKLPEWIKDWSIEDHCDECGRPNSEREREIFQALAIAWEAMQGEGHICPEEDHKRGKHWGGCLKDAIRRIEELGK